LLTALFSQTGRARYHVIGTMRPAGEGQNALLQIDDNERSFFALSSNMVSPYLLLWFDRYNTVADPAHG
jgi:hypothetical protein